MDCQNYYYYLYGWWASEQMPMYHQSNSDNFVCHLFPTQKHEIFQFPLGMSPLLARILICHSHLYLLSRCHNPGDGSFELIKILIHSSGSPSVVRLLLQQYKLCEQWWMSVFSPRFCLSGYMQAALILWLMEVVGVGHSLTGSSVDITQD